MKDRRNILLSTLVGSGLVIGGNAIFNGLPDYSPKDSVTSNLPYQDQPIVTQKTEQREIREPACDLSSKLRVGPVYDESRVPANNCSRYVRFAAKDMFGVEYPAADAWNLRDFSSVEHIPVSDENDVRNRALKGEFIPGDVLAVYNPNSSYNSNPRARKVGYTHVLLYLGKDDMGEMHFADKFGSKTRKDISLHEIIQNKLKPVETLRVKGKSKK